MIYKKIMSYYQKNNFSFTDHAIVRAKERITEYSKLSNLMVKVELLNLLRLVPYPEFEDKRFAYYHLPNKVSKYLYAVVEKKNNLIVTVTTITHQKKIDLFSKNIF